MKRESEKLCENNNTDNFLNNRWLGRKMFYLCFFFWLSRKKNLREINLLLLYKK